MPLLEFWKPPRKKCPNRLGDAHGQGKRPVKPLPRHAELAVNMAGSMASFLLVTFEAKR